MFMLNIIYIVIYYSKFQGFFNLSEIMRYGRTCGKNLVAYDQNEDTFTN